MNDVSTILPCARCMLRWQARSGPLANIVGKQVAAPARDPLRNYQRSPQELDEEPRRISRAKADEIMTRAAPIVMM